MLFKKIKFFFNDLPLLYTVILPLEFRPVFECKDADSNFIFLLKGNFIKKFLNLHDEFIGLYFLKKILIK